MGRNELLFGIYTVDFRSKTVRTVSISNYDCLFSFIQSATIKVSLHRQRGGGGGNRSILRTCGINTISFFPMLLKSNWSKIYDVALIRVHRARTCWPITDSCATIKLSPLIANENYFMLRLSVRTTVAVTVQCSNERNLHHRSLSIHRKRHTPVWLVCHKF